MELTRIDPKRLNRAHWPTKENKQNFGFWAFFRPTQKMGPDGPKWGQEYFFLLIQTLKIFWAERIWIVRAFIFYMFFGSQISGLGPLGPSLGPPTWAPRGPTHLGLTWAQI